MLTPAELVARAARVGLKVLAITDHDTVDGVAAAQAAGAQVGLEVISGVEINCDVPGAEVHTLGYYVNIEHEPFTAALARLRDGRVGRAKRMAEVLTEMGAPVDFRRILEIAGEGAVGRPHVARALLEAGHVSSYGEAFTRYIGRDGPAYVERMKFSPAEACALIRQAGGAPVLAHPVFYDRYGAIRSALDLDVVLPELVGAGLMGIEVYYSGYDAITVECLLATARRYSLVVTGGTDFHGGRPNEAEPGSVYVPMKAVRRLRAAWEQLSA
jgi:predicted metal-dependent phosphoesterase TrpH